MQRAVRLSEIIDHRLAPVVVVARFFSRLCSSRYLGSGSIATKMHRSCGLSTVWYILLGFQYGHQIVEISCSSQNGLEALVS